MKRLIILAIVAAIATPWESQAQGRNLSKDESDACSALLCLASSASARPGECRPPIARYFNIVKRTFSATVSARADFLKLCPTASTNAQTSALVQAITQGTDRCDAKSLNRDLTFDLWIPPKSDWDTGYMTTAIKDVLPSYCSAYYDILAPNYERTDKPVYVGKIGLNGRWEDR